MKSQHYSCSKLAQYRRCPYSYKLARIDKVPFLPSPPMLKGTGFHKVAEEYLKHLVKTKQESDLKVLADCMLKAMSENKDVLPEYHKEVFDIVKLWAKSYRLNYQAVVQIEGLQKIPILGSSWWFVFDLLQIDGDTAIITDWKTDARVDKKKEPDKDFTMRAYACCAQALYPKIKETVVRLAYVRHGVIKEATLGLKDMFSAKHEMEKGIQRIEADKEFLPTPGYWCNWCMGKDKCKGQYGQESFNLS